MVSLRYDSDDCAAYYEATGRLCLQFAGQFFAHYCMSFMRCSEIILGPRERCREMLDVIASC